MIVTIEEEFIKYGEEKFEFNLLEEVSEDMLDEKEREWILKLKSRQEQFGYNVETGGHPNKHDFSATYRKPINFRKKLKKKRVCFWTDERWLKLFDARAKYLSTTRSALLQNMMINVCLSGNTK